MKKMILSVLSIGVLYAAIPVAQNLDSNSTPDERARIRGFVTEGQVVGLPAVQLGGFDPCEEFCVQHQQAIDSDRIRLLGNRWFCLCHFPGNLVRVHRRGPQGDWIFDYQEVMVPNPT